MKRLRVFNIALTVLLSLCFILLGVFCFNTSYLRLLESLGDLWQSVKFYGSKIFGFEYNGVPSVTEFSEVMKWNIFLPEDLTAFKEQAGSYFKLLFSVENLSSYGKFVGEILLAFMKIFAIALPCIVIFILLLKRLYKNSNNNYNKDTVPLRVFKWISNYTYQPIKRCVTAYIKFLKDHNFIWILWLILWAIQLNLATIIVAFFAYYFYFVMSFDFATIYIQFAKLFIDLQVAATTIPIAVWLVLGYVMFAKWRKRVAISRLNHYEARNCGFINELPIVSMSCGSMGKKKTTLITDMALSQEVMFRQKAFDLLQKNDMKFPNFPWICFEQELKACMEHKTVYNLATIKEWIKLKRKRFDKHQNEHLQLYGYDYKKYGTEYYDGLQVSTLFDILERYALLYFIYVIESSLIVANYSIRTDNMLLDSGNFPMWYTNFFPEQLTDGRHAKILDFDTLRLGKKVIEENPNIGSFEFGVVVISEVGKERGNNLELREMKKGTDETNQKNDLFNAWLKMCRHSATVDNFPFIKVFTDEQRPESWGADARDLCDVIHIVTSGETKLAMPFYTIEDMLSEWAFNGFIGLYYDFRFRRGDNTLLVHILKALTSFIWRRNMRIYNKYGYSILRIEKERGTMDGKIEKKRYFIMSRKIYSRRFSTDCFSDYFNELAKNTKVGLADYREYATEKATVEELKLQNSYFINSLYK